jgi:hypothetical protein
VTWSDIESIATQIKDPHDQFETGRPAFESMGGEIVVGCYPFGEIRSRQDQQAADRAGIG